MIMPDYTLFLQLANFLFLLFILNIILYRPVRRVLGKRKAEIDGLQHSVSELEGMPIVSPAGLKKAKHRPGRWELRRRKRFDEKVWRRKRSS